MGNDIKDDNEMIACAIARMEDDGVLYKRDGKPNIPELMKRTGMSRQRARTLAGKGFKMFPHGNTGKARQRAIGRELEAEIDRLLSKGVTNTEVLYRVAREKHGYEGSISSIKRLKASHSSLIPYRCDRWRRLNLSRHKAIQEEEETYGAVLQG